jgi:hypothetical protein
MKLRTLALVVALGCGLTGSAVAKKKTPHSTAATAKRVKVKKYKSRVKHQKVQARKVKH